MFAGKEVNLRYIERRDLEMILRWRNSSAIKANMLKDHIISWHEHRKWFDGVSQSSSDIYFVVEWDNIPVGLTYFNRIDADNGTAFWGFYIGEPEAPRGVGSKMAKASICYAFCTRNVRKICGEVLVFNKKSRRIFEKMGFEQEGYLRQHVYKRNQYVDLVVYGMLRHEWIATQCQSSDMKDRMLCAKEGL